MADNDDDDDLPMDDVLLDSRWPAGNSALIAPQLSLPKLMLEAAMSARALRRFRLEASLAVVVRAPSAEWVEPLLAAGSKAASWNLKLAGLRNAQGKAGDARANGQVVDTLGRGFRAIGISHMPDVLLPPALIAAADLTLDLVAPADTIIGKAIEFATGSLPRRMPKGIAAGLDFATICSAIRVGSSPAECVRRLVTAGKMRFAGDAALASVPELSALHGYGEAMAWANRLIGDLASWRKGDLDFAALERGVVLASDPGLGKTTFVRSLAKTARLPLFVSSVGSWFASSTGHLDGVIKQVDVLFQSASAAAPAIVFLDEIESIPNRATMDRRNEDYWLPVVGHILTTLDGAGSGPASRLIVIGATNFPGKLDSALVRPGRLSKIIQIARPDVGDLEGILRQHLGKDLPEADLGTVARIGVGATGAEAEGWIRSARAAARFAGRRLVLQDLLNQVCPDDEWLPAILHRVAIHEAGHATIVQVLGLSEVQAVSVIGKGASGGRTTVAIPDQLLTRAETKSIVTFALAGLCAEEIIVGSASSGAGGGDDSDLARATEMLAILHASMGMGETLLYRAHPGEARRLLWIDPRFAAAVESDLQRLHARATELVTAHRPAVERVAAALIAERFLSGKRFREVFAESAAPAKRMKHFGGQNG